MKDTIFYILAWAGIGVLSDVLAKKIANRRWLYWSFAQNLIWAILSFLLILALFLYVGNAKKEAIEEYKDENWIRD